MKPIAVIYGEIKTDMQKKALEQISSVILDQTLQYPSCIEYSDNGDYSNFRCIYIGTKNDNPYIAKESKVTLETPEQYHINVSDDRVIIEGYDYAGVLYGCVDFYNKYIVKFENKDNAGGYFLDIFNEEKLPEFDYAHRPPLKTEVSGPGAMLYTAIKTL